MSPVEMRSAEVLRAVDPIVLGSRLRSARVARGWTQAELAGDISVAYVSRIETGSRRPTLNVLLVLAQRLGVSLEELLDGASSDQVEEIRLGLAYAELALQNGETVDAEHQARHYLDRAESASLSDLVAQGRFLVARTLESLGQLDEAITAYEAILESATGVAAIRCGIALSRCYREVGDLNLATDVGERVRPALLAGGLERTDEGIQLAMTVALAYIERGDLSRASRICTEAIKVAEEIASPTARSAAYWNASIVYSERGETGAALALANRALALLGEGQDARNLARLRLELGRLQLTLDPPEITAALEQLRRGTEDLRATSASPVELAHGDIVMARALLLDGRPEEAVEAAERARDATPADAVLGKAEAVIVLADALAEQGHLEQARSTLAGAAELLVSLEEADRWAAQAWCEVAELFERFGEIAAARDAYKRAAAASGLRVRTSRHRAATAATPRSV
ncbi:helix-turn-helix domain-containing protein [Nocardioides stalactiti]|uniref:helix-turn-helix domain-containing protein n=1 Tax=Nocardioides stalactiti TaxID=2755356 RepID=UPI00160247C5|nr:helix-turn-helix domain-containing protein [Nocardioides stalactiti]